MKNEKGFLYDLNININVDKGLCFFVNKLYDKYMNKSLNDFNQNVIN